MNLTRRGSLIALLGASALAACSSSGSAPPTLTQVVQDLQGLVPVVQGIVATVVAQDPQAIGAATLAKITQLEDSATAALASLSAAVPTLDPAKSVQAVEAYLDAALTALGAALPAAAAAFPVLAPYVPMYDAAVALIQDVVQPYLNGLLTTPVAHAAHRALKAKYTPAQARAILRIR